MSANVDELTLTMAGDPGTFYDSERVFKKQINKVPFQLKDKFNNVYNGQYGKKTIAYEFKNQDGTVTINSSLQSSDGVNYFFKFPYNTPDYGRYNLTFSSQYNAASFSPISFDFPRSQQAEIKLSSSKSTCRLQAVNKDTILAIGNAPLLVQCVGFTQQNYPAQYGKIQQFKLYVINQDGIYSKQMIIKPEPGAIIGQVSYTLSANRIKKQGVYTISSNVQGISVQNGIFRVTDAISLANSKVLKSGSFLQVQAASNFPTQLNDAPLIYKNLESPIFRVQFYSENNQRVDLSLTNQNIRGSFTVEIKSASDSSSTNLSLDLFFNQGIELEVGMNSSAENRSIFNNLADGLYYLEIVYTPASQSIRAYFQIQDTVNPPQFTSIDYTKTLFKSKQYDAVAGVPFDVVLTLRDTNLARATSGLPAVNSFAATATPNTVTAPKWRVLEGPVLGVYIIEVILETQTQNVAIAFTSGSNTVGSINAKVSPGILHKIDLFGYQNEDIVVGSSKIIRLVPRDAYQNQIKSMHSMSSDRIQKLISINYDSAYQTMGRVNSDDRLEIQIITQVAGTLQFTPFLAAQPISINFVAKRIPSPKYSYTQFQTGSITAGAATTLRLFLFDQFRNPINDIKAEEWSLFTIYLKCIDDQDNYIKQNVLVRYNITGAITPVVNLQTSTSSGYLSYQLPNDSYLRQACVYQSFTYYSPASQFSKLQKIPCTQCTLTVNHASLDLTQTLIIDARGVQWSSSNDQAIDFFLSRNVDYLSIPVIFRDQYQNIIPYDNVFTVESQTLTGAFSSGSNQPALCFNKATYVLQFCDKAADAEKWRAFKAANSVSQLTLTLSQGGGTVKFQTTIAGDDSQDFNSDNFPLNLQNTEINVLQTTCNTESKLINNKVEGEITLRTTTGMRTQTRLPQTDLKSVFKFQSTDPNFKYQILQLMQTGKYKFKFSGDKARVSSPISLQFVDSTSKPFSLNKTLVSISLPRYSKSISQNTNTTSPALLDFVCVAGTTPKKLILYNFDNKTQPITTQQALKTAPLGQVYQFYVKALDSSDNSIQFNTQQVDLHDLIDLKITYTKDGSLVNSIPYTTTPTQTDDLTLVQFTPIVSASDYRISSPILFVNNATSSIPQTFAPLTSSLGVPQSRRCIIEVNSEHKASTTQALQIWVQVRDAFDNYLDPQSLLRQRRNEFNVQVKWWVIELNDFTDYQDLGDPVVSTRPGVLDKNFLKWTVTLARVGQTVFRADYRGSNIQCKNCMTLVKVGDLQFSNTLVTYLSPITQQQIELKDTLVLNNLVQYPNLRLYPRDQAGNILSNFLNIGASQISSTLNGDSLISGKGSNTSSNLQLIVASSSISAYNALPQGSYELRVGNTLNAQAFTRTLYLLGGNTDGAVNAEIDPKLTQINVDDNILDIVAGKQQLLELTVRVSTGQRRNTFNAAQNQITLFAQNDQSFTGSYSYTLPQIQIRGSQIAGKFNIIFTPTQATELAPTNVYLRIRIGPNQTVVNKIKIRLVIHPDIPRSVQMSSDSIENGAVLKQGNADSGYAFRYKVLDKFNNTISLESPRSYRYDFSVLRLTQIQANINNFVYAKYQLSQNTTTGEIECSLRFPILASDYKIVSSLFPNNQQYTFKVLSGEAAIPYSSGSIPSNVSKKVKAGTQLQFTISARDKNGNPVSTNGSGQFQARIITPSGQIKMAQYSQQQSTISQYSYFYNGTVAGEYKWIPYYALLRMTSIANTVVVNPGNLDFGASGSGIYYYDGNTETSKNYFIPIVGKSFKLNVGAAFKLRLDYADKYGNQIDTSDTGLNTTTISFNGGKISGNGITKEIELIGKKISIQGKNWIEFEIRPQRLIDYKLLLAKTGYSVVLKAQDTIQNTELASTTINLELISVQGEQKDATNEAANLNKTAIVNVKSTVRAGEKGVFLVEFRGTDGKRSVATPPIQSIRNITVSNPDASDTTKFSYAVFEMQKRGQFKIELLYTKTKISSLANSENEPSQSSSIDFFDSKTFNLDISGTRIQGTDLVLTVLPGNIDFEKTEIKSKPQGSRSPGLQTIKFQLKDKFKNKFISSSLIFDRLRMFVNDRYYSRKLIVSVESDDDLQLGRYIVGFEASIPPLSWDINLYYVQDDFTKSPVYTNSFPTANFTLQSNLETAQTQYLGVDLTSGISAGKSLELYLLLRDQLGYCYRDNLSVKTYVTGPGRLDPVTDIFIADNGFKNISTTVTPINNQFGDCFRYYKITAPAGEITQAGVYYIESIQVDGQGAFKQGLGKGRTIQVLQAQVDRKKIRLQYKQSLELNTAFLSDNGNKLKIRAGDIAQFFINTFDIFDNPIQNERYANFQITPKNSSNLASNEYKFIVSYQYGNGTYPVTASFSKISGSQGFQFNYKFNGEDISSTINSRNLGPSSFEILPGECVANQILVPDLSDTATFNCKEGKQCSFTIRCKDSMGNDLNTGNDQISVSIRSFSLFDKSSGLNGVTLVNTVTDQNNGSYTIIFNPSYAGQYTIIFYVNNVPKDIATNFNVQRSVCAADQIYCYGDKKCAKSFSDCTNQLEKRFAFCKNNPNAGGPVYCLVGGLGTCVASRFDCDVEQNFRKCYESRTFLPINQFDQLCYKKFSLDCKSISPSTSYQCKDGTCRQNQNQCPSDHVCPPGTYLCPDFSCTSQLTDGIPQCNYSKVAQPCTFPTPFKCYDSTCAADLASCPTGMTCSNPNHVLCPDNQCVENQTKCKILRECPSGEVKCDDGSCALNYDSCPQRPSCGASKGLCQDYTCRLQCVGIFEQIRLLQQAANTSSSNTTNILTCSGGTIKCPTGECLTSYNLCPSRRVCPPKLIKCSDDSCAATIDQCLIRTIQGVFNKISCFDGRIVTSLSECPTRVSCPAKYPIKCHDNFCVDDISKCSPYVQCPKQAPFRCWSSDCRASISDCPSAIHCPKEIPVLCQDGSCHQDSDECQMIVAQLASCKANQIRCSNGVCASAKSLCPSLPTCSGAKPLKCWDGKCVSSLSLCVSPNGQKATCPNPSMKYRCPDSSCVSSIKNCATELSCPASTPVRCSDFTCRANASDCPDGTKFLDCPSSDIPCPDGSCSSSNTCSQGVSCPLSIPFLCQDSTCRQDPIDCPKLVTCLSGLFLCKNGKCVNDRRNCPQDQACPINKPIRCPDLSCYASIKECQAEDLSCPRGFFKCADSSCKEDAQLCSEGTGEGSSTCPRQASFLCHDGNCSLSSESCSIPSNNCPFYAPIKCKSGKCTNSDQNCAADTQLQDANCTRTGWILCADGSCAPTKQACPTANGCLSGFKCGNGECAFPQCPVSLCPGDKSFKCPNGLCVTSSRFCLSNISKEEYDYCSQIASTLLTNITLIPCGNGTCLNNSEMCPALYDCQKGKIRCGDGSCRESQLLCPIVGSTCPPHISYRCFNGMCAKDQSSCQTSNSCPASFPTLCPDGQCVTSAQQCNNSVNKQWSFLSNGCPQDKSIKCWNGACVSTEAQCLLTNLCPSNLPIKCGVGNCVATSGECSDQVKCQAGFFRCPDFSCKLNWSDCISQIGCPMKSPFRCTDGSCAAVGSSLLGNEYCQSGVACSKEKPFRCHNGECKGNSNFCPLSLPFEQCTGQALIRCNNGSCAKSAQECPSIACPVGAPYLCSDGKCSSSSLQCDEKIICPVDQPISCISGICVSNPSLCVPQSIANGSKSIQGDIEGECTADRPYLCYDGSCMKSSKQCPLIPSCTNVLKPIRCQNGQCVADSNQCASSSPMVCVQNFTRCEDGYCRKVCPSFNGCPTLRPFQCQNGFCGQRVSDCASVSNCPYQTPFRCSDFQCKASITQCSLPAFMSKPTKLTITFNSIATGTFPIIYSPRTKQLQGELIIPSSSIIPAARALQSTPSFSSNTSLNIYPIPDSELSQTFYIVPQQRINDVRKYYSLDSTLRLQYYEILLSAAVQLEVDEQKYSSQFSEPITLSLFVNIPSHVNRLQDICIGQLPKTQQNKNQWQCINRAHSFDIGTSLASFEVKTTGKYAVIYAPNQNYDTSSLYEICGSWSCDAPSDFLLLIFLGPLVIIISLLITYLFIMIMKRKRRMQERLQKAQQGLFYSSDSDFGGGKEQIGDEQKLVIQNDQEQNQSQKSKRAGQQTTNTNYAADESVLTTQNHLDHSDIRPFVGERGTNNFNRTLPRLYEIPLKDTQFRAQNLQRQFDDQAQTDQEKNNIKSEDDQEEQFNQQKYQLYQATKSQQQDSNKNWPGGIREGDGVTLKAQPYVQRQIPLTQSSPKNIKTSNGIQNQSQSEENQESYQDRFGRLRDDDDDYNDDADDDFYEKYGYDDLKNNDTSFS